MENSNAVAAPAPKPEKKKVGEKLSFPHFFLVNGIVLAAAIYASKIVLPKEVWRSQIHCWWPLYLFILVPAQAKNSIVEWIFHRWTLHVPMIPFLKGMFRQHHEVHHNLTFIRAIPKNKPEKWRSEFEIKDERQHEASFFPDYSYPAFLALVSAIIIVLQWLLPTWPITITIIVSVLLSLVQYEIYHWIEHWPAIRRDKIIAFAKSIGLEKRAIHFFNFHILHHAHIKCNEGVSGFFGYPLADKIFGTYKTCPELLVEGKPVNADELTVPTPRFKWIRQVDAYGERCKDRFYRKVLFKRLIEVRDERRKKRRLLLSFAPQ